MFRLLGLAALLALAAGCGKGGGPKLPEGGPGPSARIDPPSTKGNTVATTGPIVPVIKLPPATPAGLSAEEQMVLSHINLARAAEKLPPLKTDPALMRVARDQAVKMAKTGQLTSPSAEDVKAAGYEFSSFGSGGGGAQGGDPSQEVGNWIKSTLRGTATQDYDDTGIGFAKADGAENRYYYVAVFGKRMK